MEEIDIIELLRRVKEGKAPKEIEIKGTTFYYNANTMDVEKLYVDCRNDFWLRFYTHLNCEIKILDKPIIEELSKDDMLYGYIMGNKINEIIKVINNKE